MRYYETIFIVRQDATHAQVEALSKDYTDIVKNHKGNVTKTEFCGLRTLAYPIKKNKKGHYVLMNIAIPREGMMEIKRQMGLNEDVLRYMDIEVAELDNAPSPLMQQKAYREEVRTYDEVDDIF